MMNGGGNATNMITNGAMNAMNVRGNNPHNMQMIAVNQHGEPEYRSDD